MTLTIEKEKLLLVEGQDEVSVFSELLNILAITDIQIIECGGNIQLKSKFPALVKSFGFADVKSYAIVQDADNSFAGTLSRVQALLKTCGEPVPVSAEVFVEKNARRVGIFILPRHGATGMLEDLYLDTLAGSSVLECVDSCVEELRAKCPPTNQKGHYGISQNTAKVRTLGTFMATAVPHNRLGIAAKDGYWNLTHGAMNALTAFVKQI